jgi:hypothetical protein
MGLITTLEEEIEIVAADESQTVGSSKSSLDENANRWTFVLPARFIFAIIIFYIFNVVKVYFVISHVDTTVVIPAIYDVSFSHSEMTLFYHLF